MKTFQFFLLFVLGVFSIYADEPLALPKKYQIESTSKKYKATIDPKKGVAIRSVDSHKTFWSAPEIWSRSAFLADDGEHLVTGYDGLNLIPQDYSTNLVLITFWHKQEKIKEITVGELFPNTNTLKKTVSHYAWGNIQEMNGSVLNVMLVDKRKIKFDAATGKIIN